MSNIPSYVKKTARKDESFPAQAIGIRAVKFYGQPSDPLKQMARDGELPEELLPETRERLETWAKKPRTKPQSILYHGASFVFRAEDEDGTFTDSVFRMWPAEYYPGDLEGFIEGQLRLCGEDWEMLEELLGEARPGKGNSVYRPIEPSPVSVTARLKVIKGEEKVEYTLGKPRKHQPVSRPQPMRSEVEVKTPIDQGGPDAQIAELMAENRKLQAQLQKLLASQSQEGAEIQM